MKKQLLIFTCLLIIQVSLLAQTVSGNLDILVPRSHNPAFSEPRGLFTIEVKDSEELSPNGWTAILRNDLSSWKANVKSATPSLIDHGNEKGWKLQIEVDSITPYELMELEIQHVSGKMGKSSRSVSIVPNFEKDFYIFHQSDEHITSDLSVEPGGKSSLKWGNGSKEALEWLTPIYNLTNPRFVLHTGDNNQIYNSANDWSGIDEGEKRLNRFLDGISGYEVPTILITGNHDIGYSSYMENAEWRNVYYKVVGQTTFSFKMGSFYVLANEWTNTQFLDWAKKDYLSSFSDPSIKYRLLLTHYYDGPDGWTTISSEDKPADLLLVGHNHRTHTLQTSPYYVLSVGTAQNHQRAAFFEFKRNEQGWLSNQPMLHADGVNVHELVGDYGIPSVSAEFTSVNNGTAHSNSVIITNKLPHDFYNGRVRFLMEKGLYSVKGGTILSQYDYDNGERTAVIVNVNIKANGVTNASIHKK